VCDFEDFVQLKLDFLCGIETPSANTSDIKLISVSMLLVPTIQTLTLLGEILSKFEANLVQRLLLACRLVFVFVIPNLLEKNTISM